MNPDTSSASKAGQQDQPVCSVLFVFYNQQQDVEAILTPFLAVTDLPIECILFDDGSTDGTHDAISSLLDYHDSDNTFYFRNDLRRGAGQCLNEALREARAKVVYVADKPLEIDTEVLQKVLQELNRSQDSYTYPETTPAMHPAELTRQIKQKRIPSSHNYLIRTDRIRPDRLFFNPFLQVGHSVELLMRAGASAHAREASSFFRTVNPEDRFTDISQQDASVVLFHAQHLAAEIVSAPEESGDVELLYEKAYSLKVEGRITDALHQCDVILKEHPKHDDTILLKIELLQRLKQFVKASELKHRQTQSKQQQKPDKNGDFTEPEEAPDPLSGLPEEESEPDEPEYLPDEATPERRSGQQPTLFTGSSGAAEEDTDGDAAEPIPEDTTTEAESFYVRPASFRHSVIITVSGMALSFLENCMISLHEHCDPADTELIIIDNVCLDDTYQYLEQLVEKHFFHTRVIKNARNKGFGPAANQGIDQATGTYLTLMHSDVALESNIPAQLADVLEKHPQVGIAGPLTDACHNEIHLEQPNEDPLSVKEASWIDSFCIAMRKADGFTFDESFAPAWFEDMDLSMQVHQSGKKVVLANGLLLRHYLGGTTAPMGFGTETELYHNNMKRYNTKWEIEAELPETTDDTHPLEEIMLLGQLVNPLHPFDVHKNRIAELFTAEAEAELRQHKNMDDNTLICFIRAMMAIDNRGMLRLLEEQLDGPIDDATGMELVQYYFDRHIYSRCRKHLSNIQGEKTPSHMLFELRIAWGEKDLKLASELLPELLDHFPAHPEVNRIAGEMHQMNGNDAEKETFFSLADQLDPFRFSWPQKPAEPAEAEENTAGKSPAESGPEKDH